MTRRAGDTPAYPNRGMNGPSKGASRDELVARLTKSAELMEELVAFLTEECCQGLAPVKGRRRAG